MWETFIMFILKLWLLNSYLLDPVTHSSNWIHLALVDPWDMGPVIRSHPALLNRHMTAVNMIYMQWYFSKCLLWKSPSSLYRSCLSVKKLAWYTTFVWNMIYMLKLVWVKMSHNTVLCPCLLLSSQSHNCPWAVLPIFLLTLSNSLYVYYIWQHIKCSFYHKWLKSPVFYMQMWGIL